MLICLQRYFPYQHPTNPLNLIVPFQALHDSSSSLKSERQSRMWQSSLIDAKPMHHCLAVPIKTGSLPFSFTTGIAHACLYVVSCPGEMACSRAETRAQGRSCMMTTKSLCALGIKSTNAASLLGCCARQERCNDITAWVRATCLSTSSTAAHDSDSGFEVYCDIRGRWEIRHLRTRL